MHPKVYKRTHASDVYSIGVLMWQISSGNEPFENCNLHDFIMIIGGGGREDIIPGTPKFYADLYKGKIDCLHKILFIFLINNKSIKPMSFLFI